MHIGIVLSSTPVYSETFFRSKIVGLQKSGHTVTLFVQQDREVFDLCEVQQAPKVDKNPIIQGVRFLAVFFRILPHLTKVRRFWKVERECGRSFSQILKSIYLNAPILTCSLDWLHFGFATMALGRENLAKSIGAKMAVSFRGYDINVYPLKHKDCYALLWDRVNKVHSISIYLLNQGYRLGLKSTTPCQIITPAVDVNKLPEPKVNEQIQTPIKIVTVARMHWIKGLDVALKAMAQLKKEGVAFTYQIIGDGAQKDRERYAFMAYQLGLKEDVRFLGKLSHTETLEYINNAHLYLQPSLNEGFCNAVLEAQALGRLCIVSDAGGLPENVLNGETGFLFESYDSVDLYQVLRRVLKLSTLDRVTISENAKERVARKFNIERQRQEFLDFYSDSI